MLYSILSVQETKLSFRNPAVEIPLLSALAAVSLCGASLALARLIGIVQESQKSRVDPRPPAAVSPQAAPEPPQQEEP